MFSSLTERGAKATLDALFLGANDYVPKPGGPEMAGPEMADPEAGRQMIRQQLIPRIKQFRHAPPSVAATSTGPTSTGPASTGATSVTGSAAPVEPPRFAPRQTTFPHSNRAPQRIEILAIAASTGGPAALGRLFRDLAADGLIAVPTVVVQHMPPLFTRYLAGRLSVDSKLEIMEATDGESVGPCQVRVAPGGRHLAVERRDRMARLKLNDAPPENACRPSADVLLRSVAESFGGATLAVILTGMGKDGLAGCEQIRQRGGQILAQDEASSVVWGMPGHVARAGLADAVLPLDRLAAEIKRRLHLGRHEPFR
jgi:two-component system chemotaxis response regulator CheB